MPKLSKNAQAVLIGQAELAAWKAKKTLAKLNPPATPDPSAIAFAGGQYDPGEPGWVREARWREQEAQRLQEIERTRGEG